MKRIRCLISLTLVLTIITAMLAYTTISSNAVSVKNSSDSKPELGCAYTREGNKYIVSVEWSRVTNYDHYELYWKVNNNAWAKKNSVNIRGYYYTGNNPKAGNKYTYKVRAVYKNGSKGPYSLQRSVTIPKSSKASKSGFAKKCKSLVNKNMKSSGVSRYWGYNYDSCGSWQTKFISCALNYYVNDAGATCGIGYDSLNDDWLWNAAVLGRLYTHMPSVGDIVVTGRNENSIANFGVITKVRNYFDVDCVYVSGGYGFQTHLGSPKNFKIVSGKAVGKAYNGGFGILSYISTSKVLS